MKRWFLSVICLCLTLSVAAQEDIDNHIYVDSRNAFSEELVQQAAKGDVEAMYNLGKCYENGDGIEQNYYKAVFWYNHAAESGSAAAMNRLGFCYSTGNGVKQNIEEAFRWHYKAAIAGNAAAMLTIGYCYSLNNDEESMDRSRLWYQRALNGFLEMAYKGDIEAMTNVAICYQYGFGGKFSYERAYKWWSKAAERGSHKAITNIGHLYLRGAGVEKDMEKAVECYKKAVIFGNSEAMLYLGKCYNRGLGVEKDLKEAARWYLMSAERGCTEAMFKIGCFYFSAVGVEKDFFLAAQWWEKAAERGCKYAIKKLADCYSEGLGVEKDMVKSELLRDAVLALEQGDNFRSEEIVAQVFGLYSYFENEYVLNNFDKWSQKNPHAGRKKIIAKLEDLSFKASDIYIEKESESASLNISLYRYDKDSQVYILRDTRFGEIPLSVPLSKVKKFERNWNKVNIIEPEYYIHNDRLAIMSMTFVDPDGDIYIYNI